LVGEAEINANIRDFPLPLFFGVPTPLKAKKRSLEVGYSFEAVILGDSV
jgi:hypothetical protein